LRRDIILGPEQLPLIGRKANDDHEPLNSRAPNCTEVEQAHHSVDQGNEVATPVATKKKVLKITKKNVSNTCKWSGQKGQGSSTKKSRASSTKKGRD
jgi:hypothetical protein